MDPSIVETSSTSRLGSVVGGEKRLLMENLMVVPGGMAEINMLWRMTVWLALFPEHETVK